MSLLLSGFTPPPQVWHVEMLQANQTRKWSQLVKSKRLTEDIGNRSVYRNIHKFDFSGEESLVEEMIVYLNVFLLGMKDRVLGKLHTTEVVVVYYSRFRHLDLEILQ